MTKLFVFFVALTTLFTSSCTRSDAEASYKPVIHRAATYSPPTPYVGNYFYANNTNTQQSLTGTLTTARTNAPWVLAIHGGYWNGGSPSEMQQFVDTFYGRGWQVFNMEYRRGVGVTFHDQKADLISARDFILAHAAWFHLDPAKGTVVGVSAGGHLAAILGNLGTFKSVVSIAGVLQPQRLPLLANPTTQEAYLAQRAALMVGCPYSDDQTTQCGQDWREFEPQYGLTANSPATYVMHGLDDTTVPPETATSYNYWLGYNGINRMLVMCAGYGHSTADLFDYPDRVDTMLSFVVASY